MQYPNGHKSNLEMASIFKVIGCSLDICMQRESHPIWMFLDFIMWNERHWIWSVKFKSPSGLFISERNSLFTVSVMVLQIYQ